MGINAVVCSQYLAALSMLKQCIERCPERLWDAPEDVNRFWRVAYHVLFFTQLYLGKSLADFQPWQKHWPNAEALGEDAPEGQPYTREDVLEYLEICRVFAQVNSSGLDAEAPSGFHWLEFNKLELQFYNIRHLQQHTGELMERLGSKAGVSVDWVSTF